MALVQLEVLNQLEMATGKRIVDLFEWIVASGVGGFLMMAMVYGEDAVKGWHYFCDHLGVIRMENRPLLG